MLGNNQFDARRLAKSLAASQLNLQVLGLAGSPDSRPWLNVNIELTRIDQ